MATKTLRSLPILIFLFGAGCLDVGSLTAGAGDAGPCTGAAPGCCTADTQCNVANPRCDKSTGKCVPCLPANDNCPKGAHCTQVNGNYSCVTACQSAADCGKSDGGSAAACCNMLCADTSSDTANCGMCGKACDKYPNGIAGCASGACTLIGCETGFDSCDNNAMNGCETVTSSDLKNCGACGNACVAAPFASVMCVNGACKFGGCLPGRADCNANEADGCELDVSTDIKNCGGCGKACPAPPNAMIACVAGVCTITGCGFGFADCNKDAMDGCEVNLQTIANCGQCGKPCPVPAHGTASCNGGVCGIATCDAMWGDCDSMAGNGCERDLSSDKMHCGGCGKACSPANAMGTCVQGICMSNPCNPGFGDCDNMAANGCEANLNFDAKNCGKCGMACPMGQSCVAGMCKAAPRCPNIMFVVDRSGSMGTNIPNMNETRLAAAVRSVNAALQLYPNAAPYGLELFTSNNTGDVACYTDTMINIQPAIGNAQAIMNMLNAAQVGGGSNVGEAIKRAYTNLTDMTRENVVFLVTDGNPNCNSGENNAGTYTLSEVKNATMANPQVKVLVVGFDDAGNGPPSLYNSMANSGLLPQPGCTGMVGSPCYYPASDSPSTAVSVRFGLERLLQASNGVVGCTP